MRDLTMNRQAVLRTLSEAHKTLAEAQAEMMLRVAELAGVARYLEIALAGLTDGAPANGDTEDDDDEDF